MREWFVIENSWKNGVFADDDAKKPRGYIPRDVAEPLLGRVIEDGRATWFTKEEGEKMRAHPEWRDTEPPASKPVCGLDEWLCDRPRCSCEQPTRR